VARNQDEFGEAGVAPAGRPIAWADPVVIRAMRLRAKFYQFIGQG